jgi:hypothetical protein
VKPGQWSDEDEDGQEFDDPKIQEREDTDRYWEEHGNHGIECQVKEPKE